MSASGYYVLLSVYRYDFATDADEPLLVSDGHEVYRFGGVLPGRALVVSNENAKRDPRYQLEIGDVKGRRPRVPLERPDPRRVEGGRRKQSIRNPSLPFRAAEPA